MKRCSIVGAGIIGQLSALALRERGLTDITIYESPACPAASWAGGGILSPLFPWRYSDPMNQLCEQAVPLYRDICDRLQCEGFLPAKALHLSGMWMEVAAFERVQVQEWLSKSSVNAVPESRIIAGNKCSGLWFPELGSIRNPWLLKALRAYLVSLGVKFLSLPVVSWQEDKEKITVHFEGGGHAITDRLLIASGAWVNKLIPPLPSLFPAKGEMLLYRLGDRAPSHIILTGKGYVIPRANGDTLVGSTTRVGDDSTWPTVPARWQLMELACSLIPGLDLEPDCHWAGVRPGNERDYPFISSVPGTRGVFVAAGHFRNGLVSAPASAKLVAQLVCDASPERDLAAYSLPSSSRSNSSFFSR